MLRPARFVVDATENRKKEAWRPECAAPRLVYDSALFFETFMHVLRMAGKKRKKLRSGLLRPRPNIFSDKKKTHL